MALPGVLPVPFAALLLLLLLASSPLRANPTSPSFDPTQCTAQALGCYANGGSAAGGVVRPLNTTVGPTADYVNQTLCARMCGTAGFPLAQVDPSHEGGHAGSPGFRCSCGLALSSAPRRVADSFCNFPCPNETSARCGGWGHSFVSTVKCASAMPPAPRGPALPAGLACSQAGARGWPFCNQSLPVDVRVADLVGRISMAEAGPLLQARSSIAIPRLGLPPFYWGSNAIHGIESGCIGAKCPTSYPDTVAMAAGWNMTNVAELGRSVGTELRVQVNLNATGVGLTAWSPTINIIRDPRWGRSQEAPSEDPYLCGRYGQAYTEGVQGGEDPRYVRAVSTLKHFVAYSLEDYMNHTWKRQSFNAIVSPRDLNETYFPAFRRAIQDGGALGIMYAVNELNGVPGCVNPYLRDVLASWGYQGYRCTDGGQIGQTVALHKYTDDIRRSCALGIKALSDIDDGGSYAKYLLETLAIGFVTVEEVRAALTNSFRMRFRLGLFDDPGDQPYAHYGAAQYADARSQAANVLAAREALVLLKNDAGALPLAATARVAVIGPHANDTKTLQGNYGGTYCPGGRHDCFPTIFQSVQAVAADTAYAMGSYVNGGTQALRDEAVAAARGRDAVILVLGLDQSMEGEQHDRVNITLPEEQLKLLAAVAPVAKKLVVVLVHGGALAIEPVIAAAPAILDALYPGVVAGPAIAGALFGEFSPGGKLPYTVYPASFQAEANFTHMGLRDGCGRTYKYYKGTPLFPFGFGLSYSTFALAWGAHPPPAAWAPNVRYTFDVNVTNTGAVAADEVVQLYFKPAAAARTTDPPARQLCGFERVHLAPGQSAAVAFTLATPDLELVADDGAHYLDARYTLVAGRGHGPELSRPIALQ